MATRKKVTLISVFVFVLAGVVLTVAGANSGVPAAVWSLKGNRGSEPGIDFLGTSDNQPLIVKTNSIPVLTLGSTGPVEVHKAMIVHGDTTVDRALRVGGDLSVSGEAQFARDAHVVGSLTADGASHVGGVTLDGGAVHATSISVSGPSSFSTLTVTGTTRTGVLEITGGDLAEPFTLSGGMAVTSGAVVVIDEKNPAQLTLSTVAYDRRVAGVVSGAGGINAGVIMYREGASKSAQYVALVGRVYAQADTSNGPIAPGDLLTTSAIPGHVMKVTDYQRAHGAVVGKAISTLDKDEGLVLMLVTLQ